MKRTLLAVIGTVGIFTGGLGAGVVVDQTVFHPATVTADAPSTLPKTIGEAWSLVHDRYVDQSAINDDKMTQGAISGMLDAIGDEGHTRYLTKEQLAEHEDSLSGSYVGVGMQVEERNDQVVVVAPIDGSPAEQAGVRAGDVLVQVNGQSVEGMPLDQVIQMVRGPEGSTVNLVFQRPGQDQPISLTLTRKRLEVSAVDWVMLPGPAKIADIRISQFSHGASDQLAKAIRDAQAAGATGIVLDLRNNPGGLVDEAIGVASQFLPSDAPVFISQVRSGQQTVHRADANVARTDLPLVVLVNQGSASASEIVSGALQENGRAKIVGEKTFGTGTVLS
ncbi:MAG: S41 family peptidase, partial [Thermomicrobiaceae bacterium]|nr:S41 family peptidase [Thermomicrobiaceae bacterium]